MESRKIGVAGEPVDTWIHKDEWEERENMAEVWREDFIGLVKRMGDEEQTHDNTGVDQESVFKFFHEIEPEEEKNKISEWEKAMGIV